MFGRILAVPGTVLAALAMLVAPSTAAAATPGYISGVLTSATTGAGVPNVSVRTHVIGVPGSGPSATTGSDGAYQIEFANVTAPTHVQLCFYTRDAFAGAKDPGYLNQCYLDVFWPHPLGAFPDGLSTVTVRPGHTTAGVDMALAVAAGISGRLVSLADGAPLPGQAITVYDASGKRYDEVFETDSAGRYVVRQQPAGDYRMCVENPFGAGLPSPGGYFPVCYPSARIKEAGSVPPENAVPITVTAGQVAADRTIRVPAAAAIAGTLSTAAGGVPLGISAVVMFPDGTNAGGVFRYDHTGAYTITGLHPRPAGYAVCFHSNQGVRSNSQYHFAPECAGGAAWLGNGPPPAGATLVPATANTLTDGVDVALDPGAAVKGQVLDADSGDPLSALTGTVRAYSPGGVQVAISGIARHGNYTVFGLSPASSYLVCFDPDSDEGDPYLSPTCYRHAFWTRDDAHLPAGAAAVSVIGGQARTGVKISVSHRGAIHGIVRVEGAGFPYGMAVEAFDATGMLVQKRTITSAEYTLVGLPQSAGYTVCFDPTPSTYRTDLAPQCYHNVDWNGDPNALPTGTTPVPVSNGVTAEADVTLHLATA